MYLNKISIFIIFVILISITNLFPLVFAITFEDYINNEIGFEIRYPTDWEIRENVDPGAVYFVAPPPNDLTTSLIIDKSPLDYPDMTLEDMKDQILSSSYNSSYGSIDIIDVNDKDYYLGGYPAIRIEGIMDPGFVKQKIIVFGSIIDNYSYGFMAMSDPSNFDTYAPIFQSMLSSFSIINNQDTTDIEMIINKVYSPVSANASALGSEQAKITIVEFADYQDPFSANFFKETKDSIINNLVQTGQVKFLYKDLIVNDRQNDNASTLAASASYCAAEQGMYWQYHDELYKNSKGENTGWVTKDNLNLFAKNIGIYDLKKFSECLDSDIYNVIVKENDSLAKNIGLTSSPTFLFYNGTTPVAVQGAQPYTIFEEIINAMK